LLFTFSGCKPHEVKEVRESFPNKQDHIVRYYKDEKHNKLNYRKEVFYQNGKKDYVGEIVNGEKSGIWIWWYENGQKKDQCKYDAGYYIDTVYHWYENGNLRQLEIMLVKSKRTDSCSACDGTIIRYNKDGSLSERSTRVDGKLEGFSIHYDNGNYRSRTYKNDTLNGPAVEYYKNTDSTEESTVRGDYKNGKEDGLWKVFLKDSILYKTIVYKEGMNIRNIMAK